MENIIRIRRKFVYEGIELKIVERNELYLNSREGITMTRVIAPNGGSIPIQVERRETLKSIINKTKSALKNFERMGANVRDELTRNL